VKHISKIEYPNDFIILLTFNFKQCEILLVQIYCPPTDKTNNEDTAKFIRKLYNDTKHLPSKYRILMGDFNAIITLSLDKDSPSTHVYKTSQHLAKVVHTLQKTRCRSYHAKRSQNPLHITTHSKDYLQP
jgi:hypothetical protein